MNDVRIAVIGVGHLGQVHARLLRQVAGVQLVGVVDPAESARNSVGAELNVPAFASHQPLLDRIDAAIIAVPSRWHYAVAIELLQRDIHVFLEKPMTLNVGDADDLIAEAASRGLVLQVGHVERFNPALAAVAPQVREPKYIDAVRSGPFTCRSTDIGAVLDLMIHDIDVVLSLVDDELVSVEALGAAVIGPNEDWAQARLTFAGGCVANLFASRVAWQARRAMQVVCRNCVAEIDFGARGAKLMRTTDAVRGDQIDVNLLDSGQRSQMKDRIFQDYLPLTELPVSEANPLLEEQREFVGAICDQTPVRVSGADGRRALDVAERILTNIAAHRWDGHDAGPVGPRFQIREGVLRGPHGRQAVRRKAG